VNRSVSVLTFLVATAAVSAQGGERDVFEYRQHFVIEDKSHSPVYVVTKMNRNSEAEDSDTFLIEDATTRERWIIVRLMDFTHQDVRYEIRPAAGGAKIAAWYALPFGGRTRTATLEAFHKMTPEVYSKFDVETTVDTGGRSVKAKDSEWTNELKAREWRTELRRVASPSFIEALERMRGTLYATTELQLFCQMIARRVLYAETCEAPNGVATDMPPDCDFDAAFGYPCSEKQKKKIEKAKEEKRVVGLY
jgi:hypothetical protein